jgi:predicted nucleotidyltransferase
MKLLSIPVALLALVTLPAAARGQDATGLPRDEEPARPANGDAVEAITFTDIQAGLPGVSQSAVAWGDYDNDGDLDLVLTGQTDSGTQISGVYRNNGAGGFADIGAGLPGVIYGSVAWGDYDNDGDLDLLLTGFTGRVGIALIYRNDGADVFTDANAGLPAVRRSAAAWGDYDNDGDLDVLLTGQTDSGMRISGVYRNDGTGGFTDINAGLPGVSFGAVAWADYDNDGDLDLLLSGTTGAGDIARVYRNDGAGVFTDINAGLPGLYYGSVAWGDYDSDGDLDIVLVGSAPEGYVARIYRNNGAGGFADASAGLRVVGYGSVTWGDYDNDGDLDVLLAGTTGSSYIARIYRNGGPTGFADAGAGLEGVCFGTVAWGDYDGDGDLDLLLTGCTNTLQRVARVYRSNGAPANTPPTAPTGLSAQLAGGRLTLSWSASTDGQTPAAGLSYNLRVGTTRGGSQIISAMASAAIGTREVVQLGNAQKRKSWTVSGRPHTPRYYWSVQAVDGAYAGSPFAEEEISSGQPFVEIGAALPGVRASSVAWGDYNNDGRLDLFLAGDTGSGFVSRIYRNETTGEFSDIGAGLPGVSSGTAAWGDYDNDGDLDLLLAGDTGSGLLARLYRNDGGGVFTDVAAGLPGVSAGSAAWGDYDNDGDLDLLLAGGTGSGLLAHLYRNDGGGAFTDVTAGLPGLDASSAAWGDYDNDGDLDLLLAGDTGSGAITRVYRNDDGALIDVGAALPQVTWGSAAWGDYDNDGDLDIALTGYQDPDYISGVYRNDGGGVFADILAGLPAPHPEAAPSRTSIAWGDYDNVGDLDLVLTTETDSGYVALVYSNGIAPKNTPPSAPGGLSAEVVGDLVELSWGASVDGQTPAAGLSYNLRIGLTPGGSEITSAMASPASGYRRVVQLGNAQQRRSWSFRVPRGHPFYWGVQAVDGAYAGSAFSPEQSFRVIGFTDIAAGLPGVSAGTAAWGDYDDDGDLDVLLAGAAGGGPLARIYRNEGAGTFTDIVAGLPGLSSSSAAWGDYDSDGDLDLLLTGDTGTGFLTRVYRNDGGGTFTDIAAGLPGVSAGAVAWGDYDNDGDLDLLLTGDTETGFLTRIYRNDGGGAFADIAAGLPGLIQGAAAWGDYDNDGDLDFVLTGVTGSGSVSRVCRNDGGGAFIDIGAGLPGVAAGSVAWGDYDDDGDLDILLTGDSGAGLLARVYRNDGGGTFTDIVAALPGVSRGAAAWGDYDNDGDLDLLLAGVTGSGYLACVYRNDGGSTFADIQAELPGVSAGSAAWGDCDNDGDLDLLLAGDTGSGSFSRIYRSDGAAANAPPAAPSGLSAQLAADRLTLSWGASTDGQTPAAGLSYNLRVGTTPGGSETAPAMASAASGYRRVVQLGNAQERRSWTLRLPPGSRTYYWTVQALDGAFAGSPFATVQSLTARIVVFTDAGAGLDGVSDGAAAWGDYDNDGDLDLALAGDAGAGLVTRVYRNDGAGAFTDVGAGLPGVSFGSVAWGDYDNDGDLDLALAGDTGAGLITRVYRNDGAGAFADAGAGLPGVSSGSVAWGDYDNDGDLDLLLTGDTGAGYLARVYQNVGGGAFTDVAAALPGVRHGCAAWGDYDNDGDLDLVLAGDTGAARIARVYRNVGAGVFNDIGAGLVGVDWATAAWGDYDSDGDLDLVLAGDTGPSRLARVYRNDGADAFTNINAGLAGLRHGSAAWGDYDNDGDLDLLVTGDTDAGYLSRVYRNDAEAGFADAQAGLPGVDHGSGAWGDYDNDGDLDLLLAGLAGTGAGIARVYRSDGAPVNAPPVAPGGLSSQVDGDQVTLSWSSSADAQTPAAGLSYNLRVGLTPGGDQLCPGMADTAGGYRRVVQLGNAQKRTSWGLRVPAGHVFYWSVQAVDGAYAGSPFATERSFGVVRFTGSSAGLPGVSSGAVAWGDYDNDGDLDVLLTGQTGVGFLARVYRNDGPAGFTDIAAGFADVYYSSAAWGDYDNDGDLDVLLTGNTGPPAFAGISRVYRNDGGGAFSDIAAGLPGVFAGAVAWGDCDNDGDLDILLTGDTGVGYLARVYRNDGGGAFSDIAAGLPGVASSAVAWGDYDNDGDLDILLAGDAGTGYLARVYRNDGGGAFSDIAAGLPGVGFGAVAWGDYDNDSDLDILLTGDTGREYLARVYRNDGSAGFTQVAAGLPGVYGGAVAWGDYDNDGDPDILLTGDTGSARVSRVYRNNGATFTDTNAGLAGVYAGSAAWGDYDNDGDLDILLTGDAGPSRVARVHRGDGAVPNTPPAAPEGLSAQLARGQVTLSWRAATDDRTPAAGLSYNLRVGTAPGGCDVIDAMASPASGYRRVVQLGNAQQRTSWTVNLPLGPGHYHWSVQALDGVYAGSPFAVEQEFVDTTGAAAGIPKELSLAMEGANPVVGEARFRFALPSDAWVELSIHDVSGRQVAALLDGELPAGYHTARWGPAEAGAHRPPGVYFVRLVAAGRVCTRRVVVLQ